MTVVRASRRLAWSLASILVAGAVMAAGDAPISPAGATTPASPRDVEQPGPRPDVVMVLLDDVNPHDGRLFGPSLTPRLNELFVARGITFSDFHGETPNCCPGRVGFLTGQHTLNSGQVNNDGKRWDARMSIAVALQERGYFTIYAGKYLNGYRGFPDDRLTPAGWSRFDAIYEANGRYFDYEMRAADGTIVSHGSAPEDYSTDVIAATVVDRLREVPHGSPLFALIAPYAVHEPLTMAPRHAGDGRCRDVEPWVPASYDEADVTDKPAFVQAYPRLDEAAKDLVTRCEMLLSVDDLVGRIHDELRAQGRAGDALYILTADNGRGWGEHRIDGKRTAYSTPIPLYVAGHGVVGGPRTDDSVLANIDIAPTICDLAGCTLGPYPNGQAGPDGRSFAPLLAAAGAPLGRQAVLGINTVDARDAEDPGLRPPWSAIRTTGESRLGRWHYVEYENGERELYDLSGGPCSAWRPGQPGDPCELENLLRADRPVAPATADLAAELGRELARTMSEKGAAPDP